MAEAAEVRKARASVAQKEDAYVQRMVEGGRKLEQQGAAAESQEARQGKQQAAAVGVQKKHEDAAAQGEAP